MPFFTQKPLLCVRGRPVWVFVAVLLFPVTIPGRTQQTPAADSAKDMPFNFSHKTHSGIRIECVFCHATALTADKASFPAQERCMMCHAAVKRDSEAIRQLAAIPNDSPIVPEKALYKLPDFVNFSHARHTGAKIECAQCHSDVFSMDAVELHMPMRMKSCVNCHKANAAAVTCTTCHEAFQQ